MSDGITRTKEFGLAGTTIDFPVIEPELIDVNVVNSGPTAFLLLRFTLKGGRVVSYLFDENDVTRLQQVFNEALPIVLKHNHPEGAH